MAAFRFASRWRWALAPAAAWATHQAFLAACAWVDRDTFRAVVDRTDPVLLAAVRGWVDGEVAGRSRSVSVRRSPPATGRPGTRRRPLLVTEAVTWRPVPVTVTDRAGAGHDVWVLSLPWGGVGFKSRTPGGHGAVLDLLGRLAGGLESEGAAEDGADRT